MTDSLDTAALDELKLVMEDDFSLLVDTFIDDSSQKLEELKGLSLVDSDAIRHLAHSLKGSSANIGAPKLSAFAKQLEDQARLKVIEDFDSQVASLQQEFHNVQQLLAERYS